MSKIAAEPYRDIDFTDAKRGPVVPPEPGKTKITIRLDDRMLSYFRDIVEQAGGGNYHTLINDALMEYIQRRTVLDEVRQAAREELRSLLERVDHSPSQREGAGGGQYGSSV